MQRPSHVTPSSHAPSKLNPTHHDNHASTQSQTQKIVNPPFSWRLGPLPPTLIDLQAATAFIDYSTQRFLSFGSAMMMIFHYNPEEVRLR